MDYINYNPSAEMFLARDASVDEMDLDDIAIQHSDIIKLADFDSVPQLQPVGMEDVIDNLVDDFKEIVISTLKKYKKYGEDQIARFINLRQEEGLSITKAAEQCGIPRSSAFKLSKEFNDGPASILPRAVKKELQRQPQKLFHEHSAFLIKIFDENPSLVLVEAKQQLCDHFVGLEIPTNGLYKHITQKCALSLKQATKYTLQRDAARTIDLHSDITTL